MRRINAMAGLSLCLVSQLPSVALAQETDTLSYDALGRLTATTKSGGAASGQSTSIAYDAAGNRTNYAVSNGPNTPSLAIANTSANEGSPLTFTVTRSGSTVAAASASWATSNGTAVAGTNYTASSGTVSFAAGVTAASVTVPTIDDNVVTPNLTMGVTLSSPSSGVVLGTASATGTIVNIDVAPPATISIANASASEGSPLSFVVTRSGNTAASASASWATSNGTAVAGTNYTASSGTVSFAVGATATSVTVPTIDDNVVTPNLTMGVTISSPSSGAVLGTANATGTIVNIDVAPSATISIGNASALEGSPLSFVVTRSGSTATAVSAQWATSNNTAHAGTNYTAASGTVSFAAGATTATITVYSLDDCVVAPNKTFWVTLSSPSSNATIGTSAGLGTVDNKDKVNCN